MRNRVTALLTILLSAIIVSARDLIAEKYIVQQGDNLSLVARKTGHTVSELLAMNNIENPNLIFPGETITHVSREDQRLAIRYLLDRSASWPGRINLSLAEDLIDGRISYGRNAGHNIPYELVLAFAQKQREIYAEECNNINPGLREFLEITCPLARL